MNVRITEEPGTALIVASEMSVAEVLHLDTPFTGTTLYDAPDAPPRTRNMGWASGNNGCFDPLNEKKGLGALTGFYLDQPNEEQGLTIDDYLLLDAMEELEERGIATPCFVDHQDKAGKTHKVLSWVFTEGLTISVLCHGVPSAATMKNDPDARWGVAYAPMIEGVSPTQMAMQFVVKELLDLGYYGSFALLAKSYIAGAFMAALQAHNHYVMPNADSLRSSVNVDVPSPFYLYGIRIRPSNETKTVGKEPGKTREIALPVPVIARLSSRTPEHKARSIAYLRTVALTREQAIIVERNERVERVIEWSIAKSKEFLAESNGGNNSDANNSGTPF